MHCLAHMTATCSHSTYIRICKIQEREKNRNCIAINNVMKILFISTFREEYLLSENVIYIYLNVQ